MKTLALTAALALALTPAMGLLAQEIPSASPTAVPAVAPTAQPTAKPLYVDYVAPDWAKAKTHITLEQAKKMSKDKGVLFCDARAKVEYDLGHIPGAIPLPAGEFDKFYAQHKKRIDKAKKLVTYCHGIGCRLSEKSANALVDHGYKNVSVFFGGWPQWTEDKLPEQKGDTFASDVAEPIVVPAPTVAPAVLSPSAAPVAVSPAAKP